MGLLGNYYYYYYYFVFFFGGEVRVGLERKCRKHRVSIERSSAAAES
jgi:hypothetical protein